MKTKKITLYSFDELSPAAKKKAYEDYTGNDTLEFLPDYLDDQLIDLLGAEKIKPIEAHVSYSFSNSQGDGAMFYGTFEWKKHVVKIRHVGRYCHAMSKEYDIADDEGNESSKSAYDRFEVIYLRICRELERIGYAYIEEERNQRRVANTLRDNEYLFEKDGTMNNE